jgi:hypothetical protein
MDWIIPLIISGIIIINDIRQTIRIKELEKRLEEYEK